MRVLRCGSRSVLVEMERPEHVLSLEADLRGAPLPGMGELVPGARTLLVGFDPERVTAGELAALLPLRPLLDVPVLSGDEVIVPVRYDGEDLGDVARASGLSSAEVIERHQGGSYVVAFCGFAPGFAYLRGLDPSLHLPRRPEPRTLVPAGAVGIAGEYTGVYPRQSPGGWHLIGHTPIAVWNLDSDPPALLRPGTPVRFTVLAR